MITNFLKTYELTTEILNLISSTDSYCYIVSPYVKIWPHLDRVLSIASKKEAIITFVIREDIKSNELIQKLNVEFGFEVIVIKNLHIKLYLNEDKCLFSTMNLYDSSKQNNLELGYYVNNPVDIKREIIEDYILADKTAIRYPGKFEAKRNQILDKVSAAKEILESQGFCVDCRKRILPDFNPYNPRKVRCRDCYFKTEFLNVEIKYCHYCGLEHNSTDRKPFHYDCTQDLKKYRSLVKDYD
ncbi:MAG: hypothetical protein MH472_14120 [Bacteroidia bacterium]|nr:hypothetical protein [Bacteroidia bacterium]